VHLPQLWRCIQDRAVAGTFTISAAKSKPSAVSSEGGKSKMGLAQSLLKAASLLLSPWGLSSSEPVGTQTFNV
jgi:hypothetical protein